MVDKNKKDDRPVYRGASGHDPKNTPKVPEHAGLSGDARILYEAYQVFATGGITRDEVTKLEKIDEVLRDASIQMTKNGSAVIVDNEGKTTTVRPR